MILDLAGDGPLGVAVRAALEKAGVKVRSASYGNDDLFGSACGCRAIVYAPAPNLLTGRLSPSPDVGRMRAVLGATNAPPGVRALVVVVPPGYDEELDALKRYGVPYVILRAAPLIEELAKDPALQGSGPVWLPRGSKMRIANANAVAAEVVRAIDDATGATIEAPSETVDAAEAMRRAANLAGRKVVRTIPKPFDTILRGVGKLFGVRPPPLVSLHEQLTRVAEV
jgi:hypothetical protein